MVDIEFEARPVGTRAGTASWWMVAVGSVLVAMVLLSLFAPDLVTGAQQEHLPLPAMVSWLWGAVAIGYLSFVRDAGADRAFALTVAALWTAVAVTGIFSPELVTGTDPTRIPLAALLVPIAGAVATGFLALHAARR